MASEPPRPPQPKQDTLARPGRDVDAWVASADRDGLAYLVLLSFLSDGAVFTVATPQSARPAAAKPLPGEQARTGAVPAAPVLPPAGAFSSLRAYRIQRRSLEMLSSC